MQYLQEMSSEILLIVVDLNIVLYLDIVRSSFTGLCNTAHTAEKLTWGANTLNNAT